MERQYIFRGPDWLGDMLALAGINQSETSRQANIDAIHQKIREGKISLAGLEQMNAIHLKEYTDWVVLYEKMSPIVAEIEKNLKRVETRGVDEPSKRNRDPSDGREPVITNADVVREVRQELALIAATKREEFLELYDRIRAFDDLVDSGAEDAELDAVERELQFDTESILPHKDTFLGRRLGGVCIDAIRIIGAGL